MAAEWAVVINQVVSKLRSEANHENQNDRRGVVRQAFSLAITLASPTHHTPTPPIPIPTNTPQNSHMF